ncbi:carbamoyltransferase family protein [Planctomicrobium sp. SH664]|uniref:carbamoyltransferase family protein n=1 Tax=Planctomicrobium sp. SH664 TaxID=3448125 RepID=UPI003F5B5E10
MSSILGISAYYHDSAAALIQDGRIVAAAQEERFTRKKHDAAFPSRAVDYCLQAGGISVCDLDYVGFYEKPLLKFDRLLGTYLAYAPAGFRSFAKAMPVWLREKLFLRRNLLKSLGHGYRRRIIFPEHHQSHAASAFFPSPFEEAAILTVDGVGEWATATFGAGRGNRIVLQQQLKFPHSLGMLYTAFTYYCGFRVNSGEYKLMGLAPYGRPEYADLIRKRLLNLREDGSFRMEMSYFNYCQGLTMTSAKFHKLFGRPPRDPESQLEQFHMDLAASIQVVTEEILLRMCAHVQRATGMKNLCLAGGVALNCVANGRILREGPFEQIWIQPAAGDAGGALGTALFIHYQLLGQERSGSARDHQQGSYLGPAYTTAEVRAALDPHGAVYRVYEQEDELLNAVVDQLVQEKVVGWFQGRMEFGPRALGARSILGDPRSRSMQSVMNLKIKFRESFRPFAPVVLKDRAPEFFDVSPGYDSPYMMLVAPVHARQRLPVDEKSQGLFGIELLLQPRSNIPAVTHVDYSARIQTVDGVDHPRYYRLLQEFDRRTGCAVLVNTSFNVRGEPIVCTPEEAYQCFLNTNMDALVLENCLLLKQEQPERNGANSAEYLARFALD